MKLTDNAKILLDSRYFQPNETWPKLVKRVSKAISSAEKTDKLKKEWMNKFTSVIEPGEFVPATPFLMNAGINDHYFSCYVLPIEDSLTSIYKTIADAAKIFQVAGGCGYDFSTIRPVGTSSSKNPKGSASGPISFMKVFDASCSEIKQGGCVVEGTRVTLSDGRRLKIEDLCTKMIDDNTNVPLEIAVANDLSGPQTTSTFFNNGISDIISLRTSKGFEFTATPSHKVRVINLEGEYVWKELKDIAIDDWVALKGNTSKCLDELKVLPSIDPYKSGHGNETDVKIPLSWTEDLAKFIGFWFGDGFYTESGIGFSISDLEIYDEYATLGYELFGVKPKYGESRKGGVSWFLYFHSRPLLKWLKQALKLTHEEILEDIQSNDHVTQLAFMRGWFDADGSISKDGYPSLSACRQQVIKDAQKILLALGILTTSRSQIRSNSFTEGVQYHLTISGDRSRFMYYDYIGFTRTLLKSKFYLKDKHHNISDIYPNQEKKIKAWLTDPKLVEQRISKGKGKGKAKGKMDKSLYKSFERFVHRGINLNRARILKLAAQYPEELQNTWLHEWAKGDLYFDKISNIYTGRSQTYDIEVPNTHTYIADGWVSHNSRKGAQMGVMRIDHPDIEEFVGVKQDLTKLTQFNISCAITDKFMSAVKNDTEFELKFDAHPEKNKVINARDLWKNIIHNAWKTGDPGLLFIDEINRKDSLGGISATNPCSEQGLPPYGCCDLGSIDLSKFFNKKSEFDIERFKVAIVIGVRFLDNAIDINNYTLPEIEKVQTGERRIGLGVMGFADSLIEMGISYDSDEARHWVENISQILEEVSKQTSEELAKEKGAFPLQNKSKLKDATPIRNSMRTTCAPTGCLVASTRIYGEHISPQIGTLNFSETPKEFLENKEPFNISTDRNVSSSTKTFFNGIADTIKIATQRGYSLEATKQHRVRVISKEGYKWKHMRDIVLGDQICLARGTAHDFDRDYVKLISEDKKIHFNTKKINWHDKLTEDCAYFLGYFLGDGNFTNEGIRIAFNGNEQKEIKRIDSFLTNLFGRGFGYKEKQNGDGVCYNFNSRQIKKWLAQFEIYNTDTKLHIPQQIWDSPVKVKGAFLKGIYDADGSISLRSQNLELASHKKSLIQDVQRLLLDIGIVSSIYSWDRDDSAFKPNSGKMYKLVTSHQKDLITYSDIVSFGHVHKYLKLSKALATYQINPRKRDKQIFDLPENLSGDRIHYEPVTFLEEGQEYTYDLEVPDGNTYIANGFVSHNSISIIAGCSAGIEPIFALVFTRNHAIEGHKELKEINKAFQRVAIERGFYSDELMTKVIENNGSCQGIKTVPEDVQKYFKVAADLYPNDHVKMLATWQQRIQSGISKTINLPENATEGDIEKVYWQAYESGCKGITVFRDRCRGEQVLNTGIVRPAGRPDIVNGKTMKVNTALGKMFITVNSVKNGDNEDKPFEIFVTLSKGGTNASADAEAVGRLVSLLLRSNIEVGEIAAQLKGIGAGEVAFNNGRVVSSIPDAVSYVLERMFLDGEEKIEHPDDRARYFPSGSQQETCKDCG